MAHKPLSENTFRQLFCTPRSQPKPKKKEVPWPDSDSGEENDDLQSWDNFKEIENSKLSEKQPDLRVDETYDSTNTISELESLTATMCSAADTSYASGPQEIDLIDQYHFGTPKREALPVDRHREGILQAVLNNSVAVISGHTGCGKTSQVPMFILSYLASRREPVKIIVTQPRKIAAKAVAERVCQERGWHIGGLVGYQVGLDKMNKSADTKLIYVTTGILKAMLVNSDSAIDSYTHIIIDEVHERELDIDFILAYLKKKLMTTDKSFRLIMMSATINPEKFQNYFTERVDDTFVRPPHIDVGIGFAGSQGSDTNKPVQVFFLDHIPTYGDTDSFPREPGLFAETMKACVDIVRALHGLEIKTEVSRPGTVLVFLPGIHEIEAVKNELQQKIKQGDGPTLKIIPLHSSIPWDDHKRIFDESGPNERKVILSTNIAESSLTLVGTAYVIDFCLTKNLQTDSRTGYPQLKLTWASRQQLKQRKGRVGRVAEGTVFRLIPKCMESSLHEEHEPEMRRVPLTSLVLQIKLSKFGTPKGLLAICLDPPEEKDIDTAILNLKLMGALLPSVHGRLMKDDGDITVIGEIIAKLPVDVRLGKLIVLGHLFGITQDCVIIAAGLNGKSIFSTYVDKRLTSYASKLFWADGTLSDCLAILQAYKSWDQLSEAGHFQYRSADGQSAEKKFCRMHNLELKQLREMKELIRELTQNLKYMNIEVSPDLPNLKDDPMKNVDINLVRDIVIFGAFYPNYYIKYHNDERVKDAHRMLMKNDPSCTVYLTGFPKEHKEFADMYKVQIYQLLRSVVTQDEIKKIEFDGSKILVSFKKEVDESMDKRDAGSNKPLFGENKVPTTVLLGIKMGKINRGKLHLDLYDDVKALEHYRALKLGDQAAKKKMVIDQMPPPEMSSKRILFKPLYVESPSSFWIQDVRHEESHLKLKDIIDSNIDKCPKFKGSPEDIKVGDIFLAPYETYGYYRIKVQSINAAGKVKAFYVDWGNIGDVHVSFLRIIPPELSIDLTVPAFAVECSISNVQPNKTKNVKFCWAEPAVQEFRGLIEAGLQSARGFSGEIYADIQNYKGNNEYLLKLSDVTMYDTEGVKVELRQWLLDQQYGEHMPEGYISLERAKERLEFEFQNEEMKKYLNNPDRFKSEEESSEALMNTNDKLRVCIGDLKGPFSPLETSVIPMTKGDKIKRVQVEPDSVNSIIIDTSPNEPHDVWMVAANVGVSANTDNIILRNTSWLPSRPGIGPVIAMLFAPSIQMRGSGDQSHYAGAILGLGYKIVTKGAKTVGKSLYPQYDMEVAFDCRIGKDEMCRVNGIRFLLNRILGKAPQDVMRLTQVKILHETRRDLLENLTELFKKEMAYKVPEVTGKRSNSWFPVKEEVTDEIFRRAEVPRLVPTHRLLNELKTNSEKDVTDKFKEKMFCPVCSKSLLNGDEVWRHLKTPAHKQTVERVKMTE